jgi:hypothetical protein
MTTKTKQKGAIEKVVESAAEAAEEIGQAAVAFRESWDHVRNARAKAQPATRAATRATKAVARTGKKMASGAARTAKRVVGKAKRAVSRKRTTTRNAKKKR